MPAPTAMPPVLEMQNISKTFGRIKALSDVSFTARSGQIHALMGENGAGKSTLMNILSGNFPADPGGIIRVGGEIRQIRNPIDAQSNGISTIYQELALAPNLTTFQNMTMGRESSTLGILRSGSVRGKAKAMLGRFDLAWAIDKVVATLAVAERQMVEIARSLMVDARVLVMDEPTTSLSSRETDRLFEVVRQLRDEGMAIVYISHRMDEIYDLSNCVTVLRDGANAGYLDRSELSAQRLVSLMVGRELTEFYSRQHSTHSLGPVRLKVSGLSDGHDIGPCDLALRGGEIVGLAGLVGAGRTELARLIYAADRAHCGTVEVDGKPVNLRQPLDALRSGIAYLSEDRKELGLFLEMSVRDNVNIDIIQQDAFAGTVRNFDKARKRAADAVRKMAIRVAKDSQAVGSLSGGNQQKVLLSRLLQRNPGVIILDEPTRGVDVGAKAEIYRLISELAQAGAAVLVISSELPEIITLCDRVLVMREGVIAGEVNGPDMTQEVIISIATKAEDTLDQIASVSPQAAEGRAQNAK